MSDNFSSDEERRLAEERIEQIRRGGGQVPPAGRASAGYDESAEDVESEALARARARARATLGYDEPAKAPAARARAPEARAGRGNQAIIVIGGVVLLGVLIVVVLFLVSNMSGGTLGGLFNPATPTATPTVTFTPSPTETPTPTATATRVAPRLDLPNLTCIYQSGVGCYDYCQNPDNAAECQAARAQIQQQGANPDVWFQCMAPGPGPNVGRPLECLEQAWRAANP